MICKYTSCTFISKFLAAAFFASRPLSIPDARCSKHSAIKQVANSSYSLPCRSDTYLAPGLMIVNAVGFLHAALLSFLYISSRDFNCKSNILYIPLLQ